MSISLRGADILFAKTSRDCHTPTRFLARDLERPNPDLRFTPFALKKGLLPNLPGIHQELRARAKLPVQV